MLRALLLASLVMALAPADADATLVFDREPLKPTVWVAADDGSGARRLASGSGPRIAPDAKMVVYAHAPAAARNRRPDLYVVPVDGSAAPRRLARGWGDTYTFAWSPDSTTIAVVVGPELGRQHLTLIDVASGARRTVADGFFGGASFAPDGSGLLYSRYPRETFPPATDVWRVDVAVGGAPAGTPKRITHDERSETPVWGPANRVVFVRLVDAKKRKYGPKNELYVMAPDGTGVRRLTTTKVDPLLAGLEPIAFSADGTRLLAEFSGQDTSYAETVDPVTGRATPVVRAEERGFVGARLSADGSTILGATGGYDPESRHDVVTMPYGGGKATLLARNADDPDWTR